ncbi:hypothetical protein MASR2M29_10550 [Spirochaetota bacterium]
MTKNFRLAEKILLLLLIALLTAIISATVYAAFYNTRAKKLAREAVYSEFKTGYAVFDELGRIRTKSMDGAIIVVDISFPYDDKERQFFEELHNSRSKLKAEAVDFFSSKQSEELNGATEGVIKAALRDRLNAILSLGTIDTLYFSEFSVIK